MVPRCQGKWAPPAGVFTGKNDDALLHVMKEGYARHGQPDVAIEFDMHYLIQKLDGEPKIFGWGVG